MLDFYEDMANRAQRRSKNNGGMPSQYDSTQGRGRSGMIDESQLQERSRRLKEGKKGPWKPSSSELEKYEEIALDTDPDNYDPPHIPGANGRVCSAGSSSWCPPSRSSWSCGCLTCRCG